MSRIAVAVAAAWLAIVCVPRAPTIDAPSVTTRATDSATASGISYLLERQSPDGAWRSDVYATFKDGTALTPLVVTAIQDAWEVIGPNSSIENAIKKGLAWLGKFSALGGTIESGPAGLDYPVYTAALTIKALSHPTGKGFLKHRDAWVKYLKERQLTESRGWKPEDKQYGGWGYCRVIPRKPNAKAIAPPLIESNLSATLFALDALRAAGETDAELYKAAAIFVRRCQNADGGFHFIYDDPVRNKAGVAERDPRVFHSYGSTSADGFRALRLCGRAEDAPHERTALEWLMKHFRADTHPGTYVKSHEMNREAVYYYYAASVSRAFRGKQLKLPGGRDWKAELGAELAKRQHKDGSWINPVELVRENDPIVATANAVTALVNCKR